MHGNKFIYVSHRIQKLPLFDFSFLGHQVGYIHSDIRIGNLIFHDDNPYVIDYSSAMQVNVCDYYQGSLSTASNSVLKMLDANSSHGKTNEKISLCYADDGISFLKMILLLKAVFQKYTLLIKQAIADGMPCHILSIYEYGMNDLREENVIKTIQYLEEHREMISTDDLNSVMMHALENENKIDYDIDEHFKKLSLSQ